MKKKLITHILIVCAFLLFNRAKAFISLELLVKEEQKVLLLGDAHHDNLDQLNIAHVDHLVNWISDNGVHTNSKLIYEMPDDIAIRIQNNYLLPGETIAKTFFRLAQLDKEYRSKHLHFLPYDCRGNSISYLNRFFEIFENSVINSSINIDQWERMRKSWIKHIKENPQNQHTIEEYLEYLQRTEEQIDKWLNDFSSNSDMWIMLNSLRLKYIESIGTIKKHLKGIPKDADMGIYMINFFKNCATKSDLMERFQLAFNIFIIQNDYLLGDIGFLKQIIESVNQGFNNIIIAVGYAHIQQLKNHLKSLGYQSRQQFTSVVREGNIALNLDKLDSVQENLTLMLHKMYPVSQFTTPASSQLKVRSCSFCDTPESKDHTLSKCSQCKQALYCDRRCQLAAWKTHKLTCKK